MDASSTCVRLDSEGDKVIVGVVLERELYFKWEADQCSIIKHVMNLQILMYCFLSGAGLVDVFDSVT